MTTLGSIVDGSQSGTFGATEGLVDAGTFQFHETVPRDFTFGGIGAPTFGIVRAVEFFVGQDGSTFDLQTRITFTVAGDVANVEGNWTVLRGTKTYAGLRGQGTLTGTISEVAGSEVFDFTFTGSIH
jgi:hypothetical protein